MKTIAQQLNIKEFPFEIKDKNNNVIYFEYSNNSWFRREYQNNNVIYLEYSNGSWYKRAYDQNNNLIYFEDSTGYWFKREYDKNNREIYSKNSTGYWFKREFDKNKLLYFENSQGYIIDNRPKKEITMNEIAEEFGIPVDQLKIKK